MGVTQYTDMTGLSQYTEESHAGLSEYTCSDMTGLTQHTVNSDASHLTQYSDTTGLLHETANPDNTTSDFKPLSRDSVDFEITASLSGRLGLRDSVSSDVSQASSSCLPRESVGGRHYSLRGSKESLVSEASTSSSRKSEASIGKVVKGAGVVDYVTLEERQRLLSGEMQNEAHISHMTDMRNIQRPSLEGAADDNGSKSVSDNRKLSTGSKTVSTTAPESERSSTDYNQLDLFAPVADKQVTHQLNNFIQDR